MITEQDIRNALDGTLTRVRHVDNKVVTERVPLGHIPDHRPPCSMLPTSGKRGPGVMPRHLWTPDEDAELLALRRMRWSKSECAKRFKCSEEAVRRRLTILRQREAGQ